MVLLYVAGLDGLCHFRPVLSRSTTYLSLQASRKNQEMLAIEKIV